MSLKKLFLNLDFLAFQIGFELDRSTKFKSFQGAVLSTVVIIATIIIGFLFGSEIYKRQKPNVTSSATFIGNSIIYLKDFPLVMTFYNDTEILLNPFDYYDILLYKENYTNSENEFADYLYGSKPVSCRYDHFHAWKSKISEQKINEIMDISPICFDNEEEIYFENTDDDVNSTYIQLTVKSCMNSNKVCPDDYDLVVSQTYAQLYFMESYVDSIDYSDPIKFYIKGISQQLIPNRIKKSTVVIINNSYYSDNGWILEDKYLTEFTLNSAISNELIDQNDLYYNDLLWFILSSPKLGLQYDRNYLKVQDLFAKLGGILNALVVMGRIILYNYSNFKYIVTLNNYFIEKEMHAFNSQLNIKSVRFINNVSKQLNPIVNEKDKCLSNELKQKISKLQNSDIMRMNVNKSIINSKVQPHLDVTSHIRTNNTHNYMRDKNMKVTSKLNVMIKNQYFYNKAYELEYDYYKYLKEYVCCVKFKLYDKIFDSVKNKIDIKQMINALYIERDKEKEEERESQVGKEKEKE